MLAKNSIRQPVKNDLKHFVDKKNLHYDTSFSNKTKICDFPILAMSRVGLLKNLWFSNFR